MMGGSQSVECAPAVGGLQANVFATGLEPCHRNQCIKESGGRSSSQGLMS